jgi:DNA-binding transcriptional LysR family regulator
MDLDALRAFLAVVEHGSIQAAASSLGMTRTALARRLDALEREVATALLFRGPKGVEPTPAGATLATRAPEILHLVDDVRASLVGEREGPLRIALSPGFPPAAIVAAAGMTMASFERYGVSVVVHPEPWSLLGSEADVAVTLRDVLPDGPFLALAASHMDVRLVASPAYLELAGTPESLEALAQHRLFLWDPGGSPRGLPLRRGGLWPVEPTMWTTDAHIAWQLAGAGMGIAFVPDGKVAPIGDVGNCVGVLDDLVAGRSTIWMLVSAHGQRHPLLSLLVEQTRALATELGVR